METQTIEVQTSKKNAWIYAILLWFFGYIGIHKFYLNKTAMGIIYLVTGGIFGIGLFIDIISLIFFTVKDSEGLDLAGTVSIKITTVVIIALMVIIIASLL